MNSFPITKEEDKKFYVQLLADIPYFHRLYAKYHDEKYLEIANNLGTAAKNIKRKWELTHN